jgi:hypothetical protein
MGPGLRATLIVACVLVLTGGAIAIVYARVDQTMTAYTAALRSVDQLRKLSTTDPALISEDTLSGAQADLDDLHSQLQRLDALTSTPAGQSVLGGLPWVGDRYVAARDLLQMGLLAVDAGTSLTRVGHEVLQDSGGTASLSSDGTAWIGVLGSHRDQLARVVADVRSIQSIRATVDDSVLPERIRSRLTELDAVLARREVQTLITTDLSSVWTALGGERPARYVVLFQNPAELRPTGGFPGTMALVTVQQARLAEYQFFDAHELTQDYIDRRKTLLAQPWPMRQFFPQTGFLLHDALWWPDFPRSAQQFMDMYAETGWPPIDGVFAVQPEVAGDLVGLTGPFTIQFEGEQHLINADNVYQQIDSQRRLVRMTPQDRVVHKDVLGLIGQNLVDRLKNANRAQLAGAVDVLATACQRRDLQVYFANPVVEAEFDRQGCTGRLQPVAGEPTLAVTYANLALAKTSLDMRPTLTLTAEPPVDDRRVVTLDIDLRDGAVADEDPLYAGFQRWWVEVNLPDGSTLLTDRGPMQDPEAPNGGSYLAELFPDQVGRITVRFLMPNTSSLLVRRQPGVRSGDVIVQQQGCSGTYDAELHGDLLVDLSRACAQ